MNKNFISIDQIIVNYKLQDYIHNEHYAQIDLEKDGYFEVDLKELSAMLGTTYRHIQRVFSKFRDLGYVTVHDHGYLITNLEGLENHNLDDYIF